MSSTTPLVETWTLLKVTRSLGLHTAGLVNLICVMLIHSSIPLCSEEWMYCISMFSMNTESDNGLILIQTDGAGEKGFDRNT